VIPDLNKLFLAFHANKHGQTTKEKKEYLPEYISLIVSEADISIDRI